MELFQEVQPLTILLILAGSVLGWILLRVLLKFTLRIFACGCLALIILGAGAYLLTTLAG